MSIESSERIIPACSTRVIICILACACCLLAALAMPHAAFADSAQPASLDSQAQPSDADLDDHAPAQAQTPDAVLDPAQPEALDSAVEPQESIAGDAQANPTQVEQMDATEALVPQEDAAVQEPVVTDDAHVEEDADEGDLVNAEVLAVGIEDADAAEAEAGKAAGADGEAPDNSTEGDEGVTDEDSVAGSSLEGDDNKSSQANKTIQGAWTRLWGEHAKATMEEVVKTGFSSASTVVVATMKSFHDALAASGLAGSYNAPILLTEPNVLSQATISEIKRLKATQAFVCGGPDAISESVYQSIKALVPSVERLGGYSARGTAVKLYERMGSNKSTTAVLVTSNTYHDALSIAPYAHAYKCPVFLTYPDGMSIDDNTANAIRNGGFTRVIIAGGTAAVSESVEKQVESMPTVKNVVRLWGRNAYGTSTEVANWAINNGMSANKMGVATGRDYHDALTGAALCGKNKAVLVLADDYNTSTINSVINKYRSKIAKGYVFGGTNAISATVMARIVSGSVSSIYDTLNGVDLSGHTRVGIDVSMWNGAIDWSKVKASGVEFAILRVGYGSDYASQDDPRFYEYVRGARAAGVALGVYIYSYANSTSKASSEAAHALRVLRQASLNPKDVPYGVYLDLEESSMASASNRTLLANVATSFCNSISNAGYTPGVYANLNWWNNYLTSSVFNKWKRWVAQYNSSCWYQGNYVMWQCKNTGKVPGISGNVDINLYYA